MRSMTSTCGTCSRFGGWGRYKRKCISSTDTSANACTIVEYGHTTIGIIDSSVGGPTRLYYQCILASSYGETIDHSEYTLILCLCMLADHGVSCMCTVARLYRELNGYVLVRTT
jgi:hypothetical protein